MSKDNGVQSGDEYSRGSRYWQPLWPTSLVPLPLTFLRRNPSCPQCHRQLFYLLFCCQEVSNCIDGYGTVQETDEKESGVQDKLQVESISIANEYICPSQKFRTGEMTKLPSTTTCQNGEARKMY